MYRVWFNAADYEDSEFAQILLVVGPRIVDLRWELRIGESQNYPEGTVPLEDRSAGFVFSTLEFMHHITPYVQIIDGTARGFDRDGNLVLSIRVSEDVWQVATVDVRIVDLLRARYPSIEQDEEW